MLITIMQIETVFASRASGKRLYFAQDEHQRCRRIIAPEARFR
jgi:hypothetical protein